MKLYIVLLFVAYVKSEDIVNSAFPSIQNRTSTNRNRNVSFEERLPSFNINKIVDSKLELVRVFMQENGFDPMALPSHEQKFYVKGMLTHHGKLELKNGYMQDIKSITRSGDATYSGLPKLHIKIPLIIPNIEFGNDYKVKFDFTRHSGGIIGTVEHYQLYIYAVYDPIRQKIQFKQFDTTDIGKISLSLNGPPWFTWWMNGFINAATEIIHEDIVIAVNSTLNLIANKIADQINNHKTYRTDTIEPEEDDDTFKPIKLH